MNFLRMLFVIVIVVLVMIFSFNNWTEVSVRLWSNLLLVTKLPLLLLIAFLLGLAPMLVLHRASRWRWKRRVESSERALADLRPAAAPPPSVEPGDGAPAPAAVPTAVPPGVA